MLLFTLIGVIIWNSQHIQIPKNLSRTPKQHTGLQNNPRELAISSHSQGSEYPQISSVIRKNVVSYDSEKASVIRFMTIQSYFLVFRML